MNIQQRRGKFQLRVTHKLLAKPFIFTFPTNDDASGYGRQLEALLARGIVPHELLAGPDSAVSPRVVDVIDLYLAKAPVAPTDVEVVGLLSRDPEIVGRRVKDIDYPWVEAWVRNHKTVRNLAPSTVRKRVESFARVLDWHLLSTIQNKSGNPLRMLPTGYSVYSERDVALMPDGLEPKRDVDRERRLAPGEYEKCLEALSGVKHPERQRALKADEEFKFLFILILGTGLRLSEAFKLRWDQIFLDSRIAKIAGSKGHRGSVKLRTVPLRRELVDWFTERQGTGLVFSFWDGTKEDVKKASKRLTLRFGKLFEYAGLKDITEHDLRHEACCRWFELRGVDGRWLFSDVEICKIMGWSDYSMILRYASLRGEDLAKRLE